MSGLMIWGLAALALQTAPQAQPSSRPQVWDLEWETPHCTVSTGDEKATAVSFWMTPGDPDPELYLIGSEGRLPNGDKALTLTLLPGGEIYQPRVESGLNNSGERVLKLNKLREHFPAAFANSAGMRITSANTSMTIPLVGAKDAVAAVNKCIDARLPQWGIDAKAFDALRVPPRDIEGYEWFTAGDYPKQALDNNESGTVVVRVDVDAAGKVTGCHVVVSRTAALDEATCRIARQRGKFNPAIGADGQPTAAERIVSTVFRLSQ